MAVGHRRVRAWVYEVINPLLINHLVTAKTIFKSGVYTWRFYNQKLEWIRPISEYFTPEDSPNLEDFCKNNPDVTSAMADWDNFARVFEGNLTQEFHYLTIQSTPFQARVFSLRKAFSDPTRTLGTLPDDRLVQACAQHLVNNQEVVPGNDTTHDFWKAHGAEIIGIANQDSHYRGLHGENGDHARLVAEARDKLEKMLRERREKLCEEHDIPWARTTDGND